LQGLKTRRHASHSNGTSLQSEWFGVLALLTLTAWAIAHSNPSLWISRTWASGGDVASQVFYARVFMEWLPEGKISGWLPESFAGFPAFTFYFPLPFALMGLLQYAVGQQLAFKLVSMLPAFLLPAATYGMGSMFGWRVFTRLMAAAGATAFILTDETSIWGGNVLAQLAGEFAYSWGFLLVALFWGSLSVALRRGERWWIIAAVLEALVALSHGYALLVAGFGAFLFLLGSYTPWRDFRLILRVHLLAFLLIGFWLIPLIENLPWTIPNDSATAVESWKVLWPAALWPLTPGLIGLCLMAFWTKRARPVHLDFLLGIFFLALLGFLGASRFGLADLRFFPYAQWALAVCCGAVLGWTLQAWPRPVSIILSIAVLFALTAWWKPGLATLETWSHWNLSGYEGKAMWPHYLATAQANAGPLNGPRLVFEHDPANDDLGSTRTLEALPMFGSRPALEGLYMESALSGPFIYQLQAEISQRPSSPLSRFPSSARSMEDAVGHLNEFYVDRVVLRSAEKKALFGQDSRFRLVAEHGPLQTYQFEALQSRLVEPVTVPVVGTDRENWLERAFTRYTVAFPYAERQVYLAGGQSLPGAATGGAEGRVQVTEFSRERLVFETDSPGLPHLIRMTYHPRWSSAGGEEIYLADPAFMLLYPRSSTVELSYRWSWGNWTGAALSLGGLLMLAWGVRRPLPSASVHEKPAPQWRAARHLVFYTTASLALAALWWTDPEAIYMRGHEQFRESEWFEAAALFDRAFEGRRVTAAKAEALFWAARSLDLGGDKSEAAARYERLRERYPQNYWYPESVFRLIEIRLQAGDTDTARALYDELESAVPNNSWTDQARGLLSN
jgi:hypothetical protein